jgi:transposase-like protein
LTEVEVPMCTSAFGVKAEGSDLDTEFGASVFEKAYRYLLPPTGTTLFFIPRTSTAVVSPDRILYSGYRHIGTGGLVGSSLDRSDMKTGLLGVPVRRKLRYESIPAVSEMLSLIRSETGLTVSALARLFSVERPTIYAWISESSSPHPSNRTRLERVYRLLRHWQVASRFQICQVTDWDTRQGQSLLELLITNETQEPEVRRTLSGLASSISAESHSRSPQDVRTILRRDGESSASDQGEAEIDFITGRRMSFE